MRLMNYMNYRLLFREIRAVTKTVGGAPLKSDLSHAVGEFTKFAKRTCVLSEAATQGIKKGNFAEALPVAEKARRNWFGFTKQCDRMEAVRQ